jgi:hypothetical protein
MWKKWCGVGMGAEEKIKKLTYKIILFCASSSEIGLVL